MWLAEVAAGRWTLEKWTGMVEIPADAKLDFVMAVHIHGMSIQSIDCEHVSQPFRPMLCNNENGQARFCWSLDGANARRLFP